MVEGEGADDHVHRIARQGKGLHRAAVESTVRKQEARLGEGFRLGIHS